jgi:hypothetical protein
MFFDPARHAMPGMKRPSHAGRRSMKMIPENGGFLTVLHSASKKN